MVMNRSLGPFLTLRSIDSTGFFLSVLVFTWDLECNCRIPISINMNDAAIEGRVP